MRYPKKRIIFYVDGFNLYYGSLRGTEYRWLDLESLCGQWVKPDAELVAVKYFTAKVEIVYGHFLTRTATRLLENPPKGRRKGDIGLRSVWIQEEKGSDVNLASHMLTDGFRARYDLAIVISNDGDLKLPVEIARQEFNAGVGIINPHSTRSYALSPHNLPANSFYQRLQPRRLRKAQLPIELHDAEGLIRCPKTGALPK